MNSTDNSVDTTRSNSSLQKSLLWFKVDNLRKYGSFPITAYFSMASSIGRMPRGSSNLLFPGENNLIRHEYPKVNALYKYKVKMCKEHKNEGIRELYFFSWHLEFFPSCLVSLSRLIRWGAGRRWFAAQLVYVIVSITKFSMVIGSPSAYLSRNRRAITCVSDYRCPIWTFSNRTPVIGYPRDFHVNYARFNGFLSNVFYSFQILG